MKTRWQVRLGLTLAGWIVALGIFFPILWMFLTSFKTEITAVATPPAVFFKPTLANYSAVLQRADYVQFAINSVVVSLGSTLLALVLAVPAAYSMAFFPGRHTRDILLWMLSTKMLPAVGVLVPIYLLWRNFGLLDTRIGLVLINSINVLPIVVWMLFSFFREVPLRSWRPAAWMARRRGRKWRTFCCRWRCRASPRRHFYPLFFVGTRRFGASI